MTRKYGWSQGEEWPWSKEELTEFKEIYQSDKYTFKEVCNHFHRSRGSICSKARSLGIVRPPRKKWTENEIKEFTEMYKSKLYSFSEICYHFKRGKGSIGGLARKLGIKRPERG